MLNNTEIKLTKEWLKMKIKLCKNDVLSKNDLWGFTTVQKYIEQLEVENMAFKKGQASLMSSRKKWKRKYYKLKQVKEE